LQLNLRISAVAGLDTTTTAEVVAAAHGAAAAGVAAAAGESLDAQVAAAAQAPARREKKEHIWVSAVSKCFAKQLVWNFLHIEL